MSGRLRPLPLGRPILIAMLLATAACSHLGPAATETAEPIETLASAARTETPEASTGQAASVSATSAALPPTPATPQRVLLLTSSSASSYADVADALTARLPAGLVVERVLLDDAAEARSALGDSDPATAIVVAIGEQAASLAREDFAGRIVVCQVIDLEHHVDGDARLFGVEALPPPELQLRSWRRLANEADSVGVIIGAADSRLAADVEAAAAAVGVALVVEHATSDREVLYRFKQLANRVDALWLMPVDDILSPAVLQDLFGHARSRGVQTIVFNAAMLDWGALVSVGSDTDDVAEAVANVVAALARGDADAVPRITPLDDTDVRINTEVAAEIGFGLPITATSSDPRGARSRAF